MSQKGTLVRCVAVVAVVVALPWVAAVFTGGQAFGFPFPAFAVLIGGPLLLVVLAGGGGGNEPDAAEVPAPETGDVAG